MANRASCKSDMFSFKCVFQRESAWVVESKGNYTRTPPNIHDAQKRFFQTAQAEETTHATGIRNLRRPLRATLAAQRTAPRPLVLCWVLGRRWDLLQVLPLFLFAELAKVLKLFPFTELAKLTPFRLAGLKRHPSGQRRPLWLWFHLQLKASTGTTGFLIYPFPAGSDKTHSPPTGRATGGGAPCALRTLPLTCLGACKGMS